MKLKPIFVEDESLEGLYAIQYENQEMDEFERLFSLWDDPEFIHQYCLENLQYIDSEYFIGASLDLIESRIMEESYELACLLEEHCEEGFKNGRYTLQMLFRPLNNHETSIPIRQESKARLWDRRQYPGSILRLYGIRLGVNTIVLTGGAVKWTLRMEDHPDTLEELEKLRRVKEFLRLNDIEANDDLIYYYEQE